MKRLMPTGLPGPSSMNSTLALEQHGLPSRPSRTSRRRRADHLLGRNAVDPLGPRPHELDAAAGDDERLEAVGAKICEQLDHRLIDELVVRPIEARMPGRGEPVGDDLANSSVVMPVCVAAMISSRPFSPAAASAFMSPSRTALNGCCVFHSGCCGAIALTRSNAKAPENTSAARTTACRHCRTPRCARRAARNPAAFVVTRPTKSVMDVLQRRRSTRARDRSERVRRLEGRRGQAQGRGSVGARSQKAQTLDTSQTI